MFEFVFATQQNTSKFARISQQHRQQQSTTSPNSHPQPIPNSHNSSQYKQPRIISQQSLNSLSKSQTVFRKSLDHHCYLRLRLTTYRWFSTRSSSFLNNKHPPPPFCSIGTFLLLPLSSTTFPLSYGCVPEPLFFSSSSFNKHARLFNHVILSQLRQALQP